MWIFRDFAEWKALGPGGLPHTPTGWVAMTILRIIKRDSRKAKALTPKLLKKDQRSYLAALVKRAGTRPHIAAHPIPQRQLNDIPNKVVMANLQLMFERQVKENPEVLHWAQSNFERHNRAVVLCNAECGWSCAARWKGEIAHIHPSDGSMHMILSPRDSAKVIQQGWGELHSLSGLFGLLPASYTFIYAPRDESDLRTIEEILVAAIDNMSLPEKK